MIIMVYLQAVWICYLYRIKVFWGCEDVTFVIQNASVIDILFRDFIPGFGTTLKQNACICALAVMPSSVTVCPSQFSIHKNIGKAI
ncbi:hypothetical protein Tco_1357682, partial [Tanacetum coccineum]